MTSKRASTTTKIFIKAPLKTLVGVAGFGAALVTHAANPMAGHVVAHGAEKWVEETYKEIDKTFGR